MHKIKVYELNNGATSEVLIHIDEERYLIHVYDQYQEGTVTVTNSIDELQPRITKDFALTDKVDWSWLLYSPGDKVISQFKNGGFNFLEHSNDLVYQPFAKALQQE
jgi:hypothetical protein